jgi:hypothetical protein
MSSMEHFAKCATNKSVRSVTIDEEQNEGFLGTIDNKFNKAWTKKFDKLASLIPTTILSRKSLYPQSTMFRLMCKVRSQSFRRSRCLFVFVCWTLLFPEPFNFSKPQTWHKWIQRFDRFRSASGLEDKSGVTQVNSLIYSMGPEADDIFASFELNDENKRGDLYTNPYV